MSPPCPKWAIPMGFTAISTKRPLLWGDRLGPTGAFLWITAASRLRTSTTTCDPTAPTGYPSHQLPCKHCLATSLYSPAWFTQTTAWASWDKADKGCPSPWGSWLGTGPAPTSPPAAAGGTRISLPARPLGWMKSTTLSFDTGSTAMQWEGKGLGAVKRHLLSGIKEGQTATAERGRKAWRGGESGRAFGGRPSGALAEDGGQRQAHRSDTEHPDGTDCCVFAKHRDLCFTDLIWGILLSVVSAFSKARTCSVTCPHRILLKRKEHPHPR